LIRLLLGTKDTLFSAEESSEESQDLDITPTVRPVVVNALDQVRGKAETVYEPFVLQKEHVVYLIFWKCEGFKVSGIRLENDMEVEVEATPPSRPEPSC
jgi:hypothetical protein